MSGSVAGQNFASEILCTKSAKLQDATKAWHPGYLSVFCSKITWSPAGGGACAPAEQHIGLVSVSSACCWHVGWQHGKAEPGLASRCTHAQIHRRPRASLSYGLLLDKQHLHLSLLQRQTGTALLRPTPR